MSESVYANLSSKPRSAGRIKLDWNKQIAISGKWLVLLATLLVLAWGPAARAQEEEPEPEPDLYQEGYDAGYGDGYDDGYAGLAYGTNYNDDYNSGLFSIGYSDGYGVGYSDGESAAPPPNQPPDITIFDSVYNPDDDTWDLMGRVDDENLETVTVTFGNLGAGLPPAEIDTYNGDFFLLGVDFTGQFGLVSAQATDEQGLTSDVHNAVVGFP